MSGFGRERFKDVYDLILLCECALEDQLGVVLDKLRRITQQCGLCTVAVLDGAAETVAAFQGRGADARGFASMVCRDGKERIRNWDLECEALAAALDRVRERARDQDH